MTNGPLVNFDDWTQCVDPAHDPRDPAAPKEKKAKTEDTIATAISKDLLVSWSFADYGEEKGMWAGQAAGSSGKAKDKPVHLLVVGDDDETIQELFDALEKMRCAYFLEGDPAPTEFKVSLLHGESTRRLTGKEADAFQGSARGSVAIKWCERHGLNQSSRYGLTEWKSDGSSKMALEWCRKMQHFFNIEHLSGQVRYEYTQEDVESYKEPAFFKAWADTLTGEKAVRVAELRDLRPI